MRICLEKRGLGIVEKSFFIFVKKCEGDDCNPCNFNYLDGPVMLGTSLGQGWDSQRARVDKTLDAEDVIYCED